MNGKQNLPATSAQESASEHERRGARKLHEFWQRVTEGLEMEQLWGQLRVEAREGYGLYSREVDWEAIRRHRRWKQPFLIVVALFYSMLMKLSPARRVILLIAIFFLVFQPTFKFGGEKVSLEFVGFGGLLLLLLLALELADRVTMKRDLEIAREIQHWLVPDKPPAVPGVDIAFASRPANTVAGDYYDAFVRPSSGRLLVVVADVAGKSVPAALLMATFQASLQSLATAPTSLLELVEGLNRYSCAHSLGGLRFTTAFFAELDLANRSLVYINAGHNAPVLRHASGRIERLVAGGVPLGIIADTHYDGGTAALEPEDLLVIFTDGVVEAENSDGREYGEPQLLAAIEAAPRGFAADTLKYLMGGVDSFVAAARQHDDITCLVLKVQEQ